MPEELEKEEQKEQQLEKEEKNSEKEENLASFQGDEINLLKEKISQLEKEKEEYVNGWKRAKADLINYKKEESQRFEEFSKMNLAVLIKELIEVLDSFDLGLSVMKNSDVNYKGMLLIRTKLFDVLKKFGLEEVKVERGNDFDPNFHEALMEVDEENLDSGKIAEVIEKGYLLNGRLIRPAKVKVVK
jgi:molecular chaperone GrpE